VDEGSQLMKNQQVGLIDTVQLALKALQLGATMQSIANQRPDVQTQIAATRQQLIKAEQEQDRFAKLVKSGAANSKQLDDATSSVRVLKRQLAAQISSLSNNTRALNSQSVPRIYRNTRYWTNS
jgi:HlyD family secretion protein